MPVSIKLIFPLLKSRLDSVSGPDVIAFPSLDRLLSKSDRVQGGLGDWEALLFSKFDINMTDQDLPIAAVCRSGECHMPVKGYWLRVDPVCLQADLKDSVLYHPSLLDISDVEADRLFSDLKAHFYQYVFEKDSYDRWYINLPQTTLIKTNSLDKVSGGFVGARLPSGLAAKQWLSFLNEVQMLFFDHPVNQQRLQQGKLAINSVWLYGVGAVPNLAQTYFDRVYSDELLAKGLAVVSQTNFEGLPESMSKLLESCAEENANILLISRRLLDGLLLGDMSRFLEQLKDYEENWFNPLLRGLKLGSVKRLELEFASGTRFTISAAKLKRFWRPIRNFVELL